MDEGLLASGRLRITLTDSATGEVRETITHNRVVNNGLVYLARCASIGETRALSLMAIGTSSQVVSATDSALFAEASRQSIDAPTPTGASIVSKATFSEGAGTGDIAELALLLNDGSLFARSVIPAQTKSATTTMDVEWTVTFQAA